MKLENTPEFTTFEVEKIAGEFYGISARAEKLPGDRDQNFLLTDKNLKYVFKIANAEETNEYLEAQNLTMNRLALAGIPCPEVIASTAGNLVNTATSANGNKYLCYLISFLPGTAMGNIELHTDELLRDIGRTLAEFQLAVKDFDHPALHRDFNWTFTGALEVITKSKNLLTEPEVVEFVNINSKIFEQEVFPKFNSLRKSVIHNDANDYNILVTEGSGVYSGSRKVSGLIDFGDMQYGVTIGDLAIAIAYGILDKPDPLYTAAQIIKGYYKVLPITEDELSVLFNLICVRLCQSMCVAACQVSQRPDDEYLKISQLPIRNTIPGLLKINYHFAEAYFRNACGLPPFKKGEEVKSWLLKNKNNFYPVMGTEITEENSCLIDLSITSPLVDGDMKKNAPYLMDDKIIIEMNNRNAQFGIGRFNEPRYLYTAPIFDSPKTGYGENRTIHIGVDIFADSGTTVFAPMDGTVHAVIYNKDELDYGHLIILKHKTDTGIEFFSLYGHLSKEIFNNLSEGASIAKGEKIGELGNPIENGGWAPHLHFQIISDLLGYGTDFPGVCLAREREIWQSISPDPNLILNIPEPVIPPAVIDQETTYTKRKKFVGNNLSLGYRDHVKIVRGWKQYLFDENGRKYIDAYNNVPHLGHCHPVIVEAAERQMKLLNTNTRYLNDNLVEYAGELLSTVPSPLEVCYILNSASEANELAIRMARAYTGKRDMIVLEHAYHGNTNTLIDISPYKHDGPGGSGAPDWVHTAPIADVYRGLYKSDDTAAGIKYASHVKDIVNKLRDDGKGVCAFIAETCPSVGGQIFFPQNYLSEVYKHIRSAGGVCIADEVQTGYGRIGSHFYAFEEQNVVPDMIVLGKPIGNGHPVAAVITTKEIADSFNNGMEFFSTFGGNTVSSLVGMTVLRQLKKENLQQHAFEVGNYLMENFRPFKDKYEIVGDVRGSGLFLGIELVRDRNTLEPAGEEASYISNLMRHAGILMGTDGPYHNVLKIRPPMPFTKNDADVLIEKLDLILRSEF